MSRRLSTLAVLVLVVAGLAVVPVSATADTTSADASNAPTAGCSYPVTETDATGTEVTVSERPDRITVLGPSTAQTVWELNREDSVVGMPVNQYTNYLGGTEGKVNVQDGFSINSEQVIGTSPDIVLAPNITSADTIRSIRDAGITVYQFELATSLEDVVTKTRLTGRLIGACDTAERVATNTSEQIERYTSDVPEDQQPTVYYPQFGGYTPGNNTFINDAIETAGGNNLGRMAGLESYKPISQEVVANATVDWIVLGMPRGNLRAAANNTRAVQEGNVLELDANLISQPAPRVTVPLSRMANAFFPEELADSGDNSSDSSDGDTADTQMTTAAPTGEDVSTPPPTQAPPAPETDVEPATTASGNAPGFGAVVAVLALVAAALIAARRP